MDKLTGERTDSRVLIGIIKGQLNKCPRFWSNYQTRPYLASTELSLIKNIHTKSVCRTFAEFRPLWYTLFIAVHYKDSRNDIT